MFMLYFESNQDRQVWRTALCWPHIYSDIGGLLRNAPFRSQIFKIFFASGGKGAWTPLTKILRTFLMTVADICLSRALVYTAPTVSMQRSAVRNSQSLKKRIVRHEPILLVTVTADASLHRNHLGLHRFFTCRRKIAGAYHCLYYSLSAVVS